MLDRGLYYFSQQLISLKFAFITRIKKRASYPNEQVLTPSYDIKDRIIKIGSGTKKTPIVTVRLVEIRSGKTWHSYLTRVLDPQILRLYVVADLYRRRWRIESAFCTVKPLLDLSYLWTGSRNGVQLPIWGTWLF
ncbi:MAG: transposase [Microcoleus sp. T1-bin1]|nr:transposase [Microcoleus sp. T1-bin1]